MIEVKLKEKLISEYTNSFIIEMNEGKEKTIYDIKLALNKKDLTLNVVGYGTKRGKQREFRYNKLNSAECRNLLTEERKNYEKNYYKKMLPKEVVNLALDEFINSIIVEKY